MIAGSDKPPKLTRGPKFLRDAYDQLAMLIWQNRTYFLPTEASARQTDKGRLIHIFPPGGNQRGFFETFVSSYTKAGVVKVKVAKGYVFRSSAWDDFVVPSSLDTEFELHRDDAIWLEVSVDATLAPTDFALRHGNPAAEDWDNFPESIGWDDDADPDRIQTKLRHLIAYVFDLDDPNPTLPGQTVPFPGTPGWLVQATEQNLRLCTTCDERGGSEVLSFVPWFTPYDPPS